MQTETKRLIECSQVEKAAALVMTGRAVVETFKGLDIVPPRYAVIIEQHGVPMICSNIHNKDEIAAYCDACRESCITGKAAFKINVTEKMTMRENFLYTMRQIHKKRPMCEPELAETVRAYVCGYLDSVCQFVGMRAVNEIASEYGYINAKEWVPGPAWHYWEQPLQYYGRS